MFKIITIPFDRNAKSFDEDILNRLLANKQLKTYRAELMRDGGEYFWTVFVEYDPLVEQPSEKETLGLDESQRLLFDRLRAWRKETAEKDGVPVYIVATNRQLSDIVRAAPESLEALKGIKGFGNSKISKYGKDVVALIQAFYEKT